MSQQNGIGEIRPDSAYQVREFCRRTGIGYDRLRNHVPVRKFANRTWVLGEDFIAHLKEQPCLKPLKKDSFRQFTQGASNEE